MDGHSRMDEKHGKMDQVQSFSFRCSCSLKVLSIFGQQLFALYSVIITRHFFSRLGLCSFLCDSSL